MPSMGQRRKGRIGGLNKRSFMFVEKVFSSLNFVRSEVALVQLVY